MNTHQKGPVDKMHLPGSHSFLQPRKGLERSLAVCARGKHGRAAERHPVCGAQRLRPCSQMATLSTDRRAAMSRPTRTHGTQLCRPGAGSSRPRTMSRHWGVHECSPCTDSLSQTCVLCCFWDLLILQQKSLEHTDTASPRC